MVGGNVGEGLSGEVKRLEVFHPQKQVFLSTFWVPEIKQWTEQTPSLISWSLSFVAGTERRETDETEIYARR